MTRPLGVILAGGRSERLGGAHRAAKPMALVKSTPMVLHVVRALALAGARRVVILVGENQQTITRGLGMQSDFGLLTQAGNPVVELEVRPSGATTGTGGRLLALTIDELSALALVSYTDVLTDAPLEDLLKRVRDDNAAVAMLAVNPQEPWGALELEGTRVTAFHEKRKNLDTWINGGVFAVSPRLRNFIEDPAEMLEVEPMARMVAASTVVAEKHVGWWASVDTPKDIRAINDCGVAASHLSDGLAVVGR